MSSINTNVPYAGASAISIGEQSEMQGGILTGLNHAYALYGELRSLGQHVNAIQQALDKARLLSKSAKDLDVRLVTSGNTSGSYELPVIKSDAEEEDPERSSFLGTAKDASECASWGMERTTSELNLILSYMHDMDLPIDGAQTIQGAITAQAAAIAVILSTTYVREVSLDLLLEDDAIGQAVPQLTEAQNRLASGLVAMRRLVDSEHYRQPVASNAAINQVMPLLLDSSMLFLNQLIARFFPNINATIMFPAPDVDYEPDANCFMVGLPYFTTTFARLAEMAATIRGALELLTSHSNPATPINAPVGGISSAGRAKPAAKPKNLSVDIDDEDDDIGGSSAAKAPAKKK